MKDLEPAPPETPIHDARVEARIAAAWRISRQFGRRVERKAGKFAARREAARADLDALKAFRAGRSLASLPNQGPAPTPARIRDLATKKGTPLRRVVNLAAMPNGDDVPLGCEATFHHTKGLRVVRGRTY